MTCPKYDALHSVGILFVSLHRSMSFDPANSPVEVDRVIIHSIGDSETETHETTSSLI